MEHAAPRPPYGALALFCVLLVAGGFALRAFDPAEAFALIERAGPGLVLCVCAPLLLAALDAKGMQWMLARLTYARPRTLLFALRFAFEAIASTAPCGPVAADASMPFVLGRALAVRLEDGAAVVAARKWAMLAGHALFVTLTLCFAFRPLAHITLPGTGVALANALVVVAALLSLAALAIRSAARADVASASRARSRVGRTLAAVAEGARRILAPRDGGATRLALVYTGIWLAEACDTYVLLRVLGADVDLFDAMLVETVAGAARSVAFLAPGGLGAQDAAYLFALEGTVGAAARPHALALVILRRLRELCAVLLGFGILALVPFFARPPKRRPPSLLQEEGTP